MVWGPIDTRIILLLPIQRADMSIWTVTTQYVNWIIAIKWSRSIGSNCSSMTIGSKWDPVLALFSPKSNAIPTSCQVWPWISREENYRLSDRSNFLSRAYPFHSSLSFSFFPCLMLQKDTFPTFRWLFFALPVNLLGSCLLSFFLFLLLLIFIITSIINFFLYTDPRNHGCLRNHLTGTNTGYLSFSFTSLKSRIHFSNSLTYSTLPPLFLEKAQMSSILEKSSINTVINLMIISFLSFYELQTF